MKYTIGILYILAILKSSLCDIPVHCLKSQIEGKWKIFATLPSTLNNLYQWTCNHTMPSHERDAYTHSTFQHNIEFLLHLLPNDNANLRMENSDSGTKVKYLNLTILERKLDYGL